MFYYLLRKKINKDFGSVKMAELTVYIDLYYVLKCNGIQVVVFFRISIITILHYNNPSLHH